MTKEILLALFVSLFGIAFNLLAFFFLVQLFWIKNEWMHVAGVNIGVVLVLIAAVIFIPWFMFVQQTWAHARSNIRWLGIIDVAIMYGFIAAWVFTVGLTIYQSPHELQKVLEAWKLVTDRKGDIWSVAMPFINGLASVAILLGFFAAILSEIIWNGRHLHKKSAASPSMPVHVASTEGSQAMQLALEALAAGKSRGDSVVAMVAVGDEPGDFNVSIRTVSTKTVK